MIELKKKHGDKGGQNFGLNVYTGKSMDMVRAGVVEPLRIKTQAIQSAVEAVQMIMRIDDVLAASQVRPPAQGAPGEYGNVIVKSSGSISPIIFIWHIIQAFATIQNLY